MTVKHFVLDTNVLLHSPAALGQFDDNTVVLPVVVVEELDNFKKHNDELGRNAREVIRRLDALRTVDNADFREGIPHGRGHVKVLPDENPAALDAAFPFPADLPDNRILGVAYRLAERGETVILVSKDANVRVKAAIAGFEAQDYDDNFAHRPTRDVEYTGHRRAPLSPDDMAALQDGREAAAPFDDLAPNEGVIPESVGETAPFAVARARPGGKIGPFPKERVDHAWTLDPRSPEQAIAFGVLLDPAIPLVTLTGRAGTGKTLLALAAGLQQVIREHRYDKLLACRPIMPLGRDIGFLPGDKDNKLGLWMQPIYDNLAFLMRDDKTAAALRRGRHDEDDASARRERSARRSRNERVKTDAEERVDDLLKSGLVELEAITYIRGRSIPRKYVVVDEAQNLTPHEVKTIVSRAGQGTKVVLTGDPEQIDNPYLDGVSNGLSVTIERFRTSPLAAHVTLTKSERSPLAALAAQYL